MSAQIAQIRSTFNRLASTWNINDGNALANFFVEDGALIKPFGQRADGRSAIAAGRSGASWRSRTMSSLSPAGI